MKTVRWNISNGELQHFLREIRFRYFKWDTFACGALRMMPESIVLSPDEHATIVDLAERLAAALQRLETTVRNRPDLLALLDIPPKVAELLPLESDSPLQLARYDFFRTVEGGWAVSEFNEDVPGGFNEIVAAPRLLPQLHNGCTFTERFAESFLNALPDEGPVALMYATGYSEDLQHMLVLESLLAERGQQAILCSPSHLRLRWGEPAIGRQRIAAAVRFYPGEWFALLSNRRAWRRTLPRLPMMNPLSRLIRQSKRVFALWNQPGLVAPDDLVLFNQVAPPTDYFHARDAAQLRSQPSDWVLKESFGRMGENVVMGSLVNASEWDEAIRHAEKHPDRFIAQRCFEVEPLAFSQGPLYPALGAFLINGRFVGYYSRVAPTPFLTHQASYVPTVVESA